MSDSSRREFLERIGAGAVAGAVSGWASAAPLPAPNGSTLQKLFSDPPPEASPWIFWYWMNANVSREGITADLESMKANGIGCVYIFSIGAKVPGATRMQPPAEPLTPLWWDLVRHAASEADRIGLKLGLNACDGWATAGGPWITPELSMQKLVWSEQRVAGGRNFVGKLPKPTAILDFYRDVAVLGFPIPHAWGSNPSLHTIRVTTNLPIQNPQAILDTKDGEVSIDTDQAGWIQLEFPTPFTCRSVTIFTPEFNPAAQSLVIEASDDGAVFRKIISLEPPRNGWQTVASPWTHSVPQTTARFFRFVYNPPGPQPYAEDFNFIGERRLKLTRLELSSIPRINQFEGKSGATWTLGPPTTNADAPLETCVPLKTIINLTDSMTAGGDLTWDVPAGDWMILRFGHTTTGRRNDPAGAGQGLECDKFNPEAARVHFNGWFGPALKRLGPQLSEKVLKIFHVDSWECGSQNWSPVFRDEFRRRRGYDCLMYLPAMRGVPVQSADVSERFLLDIRRTIAELLVANFYAPLLRLSQQNGCLFSAECTAPTMVGDGMLHYSSVDLPMGEFWLNSVLHDKPNDIRDAVSGAHVYGKPIAQAEAFTEGHIDWGEHPFLLKPLGDHNFCDGINRFVLHVYAHQAWPDREPGVTLNTVGTFFSHTNSWWRPGKAWFDYLRRCQSLLQQGQHVADACYFTGENIPSRALLPSRLDPALPAGYKYDSINRDALLRHATANKGEVVLSGAARYRVLVIPHGHYLTPEVISKIRELVSGGATVVSAKPERSPSLEHYPTSDREVAAIARQVWADCDGERVQEHQFGKGRVVFGKKLESVLAELNVSPDVQFDGGSIEWVHRQAPDFDLYFLSNQESSAAMVNASFRVTGHIPELWHPDTGVIEDAPVWLEKDNRTSVSLDLDPAGSVFIVFRKPVVTSSPVITEVSPAPRQGEKLPIILRRRSDGYDAWSSVAGEWSFITNSGRKLRAQARQLPEPIAITGPWSLEFLSHNNQPRRVEFNELTSWSAHEDPEIRFFSGTARYTTRFAIPPSAISKSNLFFLDLGQVVYMATLRMNGKPLDTLWKPPFTVEVTQAVSAGDNELAIEVTNTWKNRLIGDEALGAAEHSTWLLFDQAHPKRDAQLDTAGLIGPVELRIFLPLIIA